MPVLQHLKEVFQGEFGSDFSKLPNRHNTLFVVVQHGFITIAPIMNTLLEMGIQSDYIFMTTKPHTTSDDMKYYFQTNFNQYIPFQWSSTLAQANAQDIGTKSRYKILTEVTNDKLLYEFCDALRCPVTSNNPIENIIICDEGGKFLSKFIDEYHRPDSRARKNLNEYHVVAIEHTKCGTYSSALKNLPFPLILMADSYLKTRIESEFIAKSMFVYLNDILQPLIYSSSVRIGIVGAGNIGKEVLNFLLKEYPKVNIKIFDKKSTLLSTSEIQQQGWENVLRANPEESPFQQSTIILGCTGVDITKYLSVADLLETQTLQFHCFSCSSGDIEFQTLLRTIPEYKFEGLSDIRDYTLKLDGGKSLTIYNGGFPMNFLVKQGVPAPESVPLQEIQITRSMKLASIVQALKLLEVMPYRPGKKNSSLKDYIKLDVTYQWIIIQAFYDNLREVNPHNKIEVSEKSNGMPQPSMNSVLKIPHYVTTSYQIKMQEKLSRQKDKELVKILVIHGTAGSGKTTLAQHYAQKQRIHYPEHLSHTILAETREQWRSSLREWAEELFPELNSRLKEEKDSEKQERLVNQYLQKAMHTTPWTMVIDNWDQKQMHIGEIEELFNDVGTGTLIITTQGQSPYEPTKSIDLSGGFEPEESQELLIKVMNLEEELAITWETLGSATELQALTALLNHLPLAVVLAGSYLIWENKARIENREPLFTFANYQSMLDEKVTELMKTYDEALGDKGRLPRDRLREEFKRLKTQEAAVDLSLKKAIQPESINPNLNLWQMLCFCGFLASDGIPQQLLKDYIEKMLPEDEREANEIFFDMLLAEARKYSLLQFENKLSAVDGLQSLHMHRVIQKVLRDNYWQILNTTVDKIFSKKSQRSFSLSMQKTLTMPLYDAISEEIFEKIHILLTHAEEWQAHYLLHQFHLAELDINKAEFQHILAMTHNWFGNYKKAEILAQKALATKIAHYHTEEHADVASTQQNLASILERLGNYEVAEALYQKSLATTIAYFHTETHIKVAGAQQNLAGILERLGRYKEAEILYQKVLAIKIAYCKTEAHISVAYVQQNLANTVMLLGDYNTAKALYEKALAVKITHYKTKEHISVAGTQQNLANILQKLGCYEEAKLLAQKALATQLTHYCSETHVEVAGTQQNLASILEELGNYEEARLLAQKALATKIAYYLTDTHINVARSQQSLANILERLGHHRASEDLYQKALATTIAHYQTETHIGVAGIQQNLAFVLERLGRYTTAEALYEKALATKIVHYQSESHISVANTQHNLANVLGRLGRYKEAELLIRKVLATTIVYYSTEIHIDVANIQQSLGNILAQLGHYEKAETLYQKSLSTKITYYHTDAHIDVAMTQYNLARLFLHFKNELEKAIILTNQCEHTCKTQAGGKQHIEKLQKLKNQIFHKALASQNYEIAIECLDSLIRDFPSHQGYYHNIACVYHLLGTTTSLGLHFDKAKQYFEQALSLEKRVNTQVEYANFLRGRGSYLEAISLLNKVLSQTKDNPGGLSYSVGEMPVLSSALAEKIKIEGTIKINHPHFFAYYLKIQCLLAQQPIQPEIIISCLHGFSEFTDRFKQDYADSFLKIYEWFLKNSYEDSEKQLTLAYPNDAHIYSAASMLEPVDQPNTLLFGIKKDIYTLFRQSNRFLMEKLNENSLRITATTIATSPNANLELHTAQEKLSELISTHPDAEIINDNTEYSSLIKGSAMFVSQINSEFELIFRESEYEISPCKIS